MLVVAVSSCFVSHKRKETRIMKESLSTSKVDCDIAQEREQSRTC